MLALKYLIMHDIPVLFHSLSVITRGGFFIHLGEHTLFPFVWECLRDDAPVPEQRDVLALITQYTHSSGKTLEPAPRNVLNHLRFPARSRL